MGTIEVTGRIIDMSLDFATGKPKLTLEINEKHTVMAGYDYLKGCEKLSIKLSKYREKRSLDANAYCFVLIDKLAAKLNLTKTEVYRNAIKEIGGVSDIVCVKNEAVEKFRREWAKKGLGWQTDIFPSKIDGCTNVIVYYGSSSYDTKQMYLLIQNIITECKELGIETRTPQEIETMIDLWKNE